MDYKPQNVICQKCDGNFTIEPDDFSFYEKIKVPPPTFCPGCRFMRRFFWRNEGTFYRQQCDLCNKNIITIFSSSSDFPIYCHECWWGDKWDGLDYGREYDFSKSFFEQFKELMKIVPVVNLWEFGNTKSEYTNYTGYSKNIYLSNAVYCENIFYSKSIEKSKDCSDSYIVVSSELCYENFDTTKCFNSIFLNNCRDCVNSFFLVDCVNCQNCFMCSNLRNKNFCIRNKQYKKEEYQKMIEGYNLSSYSNFQNFQVEFKKLIKTSIHKFANIIKSLDVDGDYIKNSKNVHHSFIAEGENLKYCWRATDKIRDSYDVSGGVNNELLYEASLAANGSYLVNFFSHSKINKYSNFLHFCADSSYLFGCIGLRNKNYCILNKQYTKEQYEELIPKIIKHMNDMPYTDSKGRVYKYGEFFPSELSPFAYNETIAQEYFPLTKEQAIEQGYKWKDKEERNYTIDIKNNDIPDNIKDTDESIINKVIECLHSASNNHPANCGASCTEAFKIIPEELQFYRRMNLPLPRLCPNCRHYERLAQRNPLKLWHRKCMKEGCSNEFETSYAPERPEVIYCERCYQQEVY